MPAPTKKNVAAAEKQKIVENPNVSREEILFIIYRDRYAVFTSHRITKAE